MSHQILRIREQTERVAKINEQNKIISQDSRGRILRMLVAQREHHRQESVDWIQAYMRHEFTAAPLV